MRPTTSLPLSNIISQQNVMKVLHKPRIETVMDGRRIELVTV